MARHGWIEERTGKRGVSVRVRYWAPNTDGELVPRSKSFPAWKHGGVKDARSAAKTFLAETFTEVRAGTFVVPVDLTLRALVEQWLETREGQIRGGTMHQYLTAVKHLDAATGGIPVQQLKSLHLQALYGRLRAAKVGPSMIARLHIVLNAALAQAVKWDTIARNPALDVQRPEMPSAPIRFWTPEQSATFLVAEGRQPRYGVLWTLALATGMRAGELLALRWSDIDLARGTITVLRTLTTDRDGHYRVGDTTKTQRSRRTIHLPTMCVEPLKRQRIRQRELQIAARRWHSVDGDLVFSRKDGRFINPRVVSGAFATAVAGCDLPRISMHGLRHSFATAMLLNNTHPKIVAEIIGDTIEVVLRVYSHVTDESRQDAIERYTSRLDQLCAGLATAAHATTSDA